MSELLRDVSDIIKRICVPQGCEYAVVGKGVEWQCEVKTPQQVVIGFHPQVGKGCCEAVVGGEETIIMRYQAQN